MGAHVRRFWKPVVVVLAMIAASYLTFYYQRGSGIGFDLDSTSSAQQREHGRSAGADYDLTQLRVMKHVVLLVKQKYIDPSRIRPREMMLEGLDFIQRQVPEVLVRHAPDAPEVTVRVDTAERTFRVDDVDSPWTLTFRFGEIFRFLQQHLRREGTDLRPVEYAAVNGMLHTLDPHSVLLSPEIYNEMRMQTRGEFGGLGIEIGIRDQQLTIIRPIPNTPAAAAKLRRMDRIVKIGEESTLNMTLQEAVNRLRGAPGTHVSISVTRAGHGGWTEPRPVSLTRATIPIASIESHTLGNGVGYIRIKNFQGNTSEDLQHAIADLRRQQTRALVLDLRDNPGGLLEQAVRVCDAFLTQGTIVTTAGNDPDDREEKTAHDDQNEPPWPMAVLVDGLSASASEIVAGALKNHDRAIIIGQTTFGKGSVQVLFEDFEDGSALKLTIAQYLTPGDVSIQSVGIVPDIQVDPMTVDRDEMDLVPGDEMSRERNLSAHLTHERARQGQRPLEQLRYYLSAEERLRRRDEAAGDEPEEETFRPDFNVLFARDLLGHTTHMGRRQILADSHDFVEHTRGAEMEKAAQELRRLGVDWSTGPDTGAPRAEVSVTTGRAQNEFRAGEDLELHVTVTNRGTGPLYQLRATTKCDNRLFEAREMVFGRVDPGQSRTWVVPMGIVQPQRGVFNRAPRGRPSKIPLDALQREDPIRIDFSELHAHAPPPQEVRVRLLPLERPVFAYGLDLVDNIRGNGDGRIQAGESVTLYMMVKNVGHGRSFETQANIKNLSGEGVLLHDGRFPINDMQPGEERRVPFTLEVLPRFHDPSFKIELSVADTDLREFVTDKIEFEVAPPAAAPQAVTETVAAIGETALREAPATDARIVARLAAGSIARATARSGEFVRLEIGDHRSAWAPANGVRVATGTPAPRVVDVLQHSPPHVEMDAGGLLSTRATSVPVRGTVTDDGRVLDLYIFVGHHKVFYQSNRDGASPRRVDFSTTVPLDPGENEIRLFARESPDVVGVRRLIIRRDNPDGSTATAPREGSEEESVPFDEE